MSRRARALRVTAWLLTPLVVWAAALFGTTAVAALGGPATSVWVVVVGGVVSGAAGALGWFTLLRWRRPPAA